MEVKAVKTVIDYNTVIGMASTTGATIHAGVIQPNQTLLNVVAKVKEAFSISLLAAKVGITGDLERYVCSQYVDNIGELENYGVTSHCRQYFDTYDVDNFTPYKHRVSHGIPGFKSRVTFPNPRFRAAINVQQDILVTFTSPAANLSTLTTGSLEIITVYVEE